MAKDSKNNKVKLFENNTNKLDLPRFTGDLHNHSEIRSVEGTNVIRVPFGLRLSKKKRPEKNQNIATLILPLNACNNPTPPPFVA